MTQEQLIGKLMPLTREEDFLKGYTLISDENEKKAYCASFPPEFYASGYNRFLSHVEQNVKTVILSENTSFENETRSVLIRRHSRYSYPVTHYHTFFEIAYVLCGMCEQTLADKKHILRQGDILFIAPNTPHSINVQDDTSVIMNILVKKSNFEQMYIHMLGQDDVISSFFTEALYAKGNKRYLLFHTLPGENASIPLFLLLSEYQNQSAFSNPIRESLMMTLFYYLMRDHMNDVECDTERQETNSRLADISVYLWNNMKTVTLEKAAHAFHYSPSRLSHLFRSVTGSTFSSYIKEIRMNRAAVLLLHTAKTVDEICAEIGLSGTEYFYRAFKKQFNMTPKEYRQTNKKTCEG